MEVKPLKQSSTKRTCKNGSCHCKNDGKDKNCECNSASEMCSKAKLTKTCSSARASRTCTNRGSKSSHKSTTTKSCS